MAARFDLSSKLVLALLILAAACTRSAAPLPADRSSVTARPYTAAEFTKQDLALTCEEVAAEQSALATQAQKAEQIILADRQRNQVAGYFAALFILPIVAVDTHEERQALLTDIQLREDKLRGLSRLKSC